MTMRDSKLKKNTSPKASRCLFCAIPLESGIDVCPECLGEKLTEEEVRARKKKLILTRDARKKENKKNREVRKWQKTGKQLRKKKVCVIPEEVKREFERESVKKTIDFLNLCLCASVVFPLLIFPFMIFAPRVDSIFGLILCLDLLFMILFLIFRVMLIPVVYWFFLCLYAGTVIFVLVGAALFIFIAIPYQIFTPSVRHGSNSGSYSSSDGKPDDFILKYVGKQRLREHLLDPDSLEIIEERLVRPGWNGGDVGYYAKYRAKNSFGGFSVEEFYTE